MTNSVVDVTFADGNGVLQIGDIGGFGGTVTADKPGDQFVIGGGALSNLSVSNGDTLQFSDSGSNAALAGSTRSSSVPRSAPAASTSSTATRCRSCSASPPARGSRPRTDRWRSRTSRSGRAITDDAAGERHVTDAIVWVGKRSMDCAKHPHPETVWPVRVRTGAFGVNVPARDLYLSPDHAVFVDGALVPVKLLINGASIAQVKRDDVTYHHVELSRHAVIRAEGLTVESYLDAGDRSNFGRNDGVVRLFPDFTARLASDVALAWESASCAELVLGGARLEAIRDRVSDRATFEQTIRQTAGR